MDLVTLCTVAYSLDRHAVKNGVFHCLKEFALFLAFLAEHPSVSMLFVHKICVCVLDAMWISMLLSALP